MSIAGALIVIAVVAVIVAFVVRRPTQTSEEEDRAPSGLRRFFVYVLLFATLVLTVQGATNLLTALFERLGASVVRGSGDLARGLAFLLVAGTMYLLLWRMVRRGLRIGERAVLGWGLYLTVTLSTALVYVMIGVGAALALALGVEDLDAGQLIGALIWAGVLVPHWRLYSAPATTPDRVPNLAVWFGSALGLGLLAAGIGGILASALDSLYVAATSLVQVGDSGDTFRRFVIALLVGAPAWWWYWWRHGRSRRTHPTWSAYVIVIGVLGGLLAAVTSAGVLLYRVLQWFFGDPLQSSAAQHFDESPTILAALAVGGAVWAYHRFELTASLAAPRPEPNRAYRYVVAGAGLLAAAGAISTLVVAAVEALVPADIGTTTAANTLVAAVTLLVVGGPLWLVFWQASQRAATADPAGELRSPSRRVYLTVLFGVAGIAALVSLLVLFAQLFEGLLEGGIDAATLDDLRVPLGVALATGVVATYHRGVYRKDQRIRPRTARKRVLVVTGADGAALAEEVERLTGARVEVWQRLGDETVPLAPPAIADAVSASPHPQVLVVAAPDGTPLVVPFHRS